MSNIINHLLNIRAGIEALNINEQASLTVPASLTASGQPVAIFGGVVVEIDIIRAYRWSMGGVVTL